MSWLGIDRGGTFTDFVWYSPESPEPRVVKVASHASDSRRILTEGLSQLGEDVSTVDRIVLGTTLATNTVLEGDGAKVGTVTTNGYRDVVEIGRQNRFEMYNLKTLRRRPLSPRRWRHELDERTEWDGTASCVPSPEDIEAAVRALEAGGVEAVAVCFLFSYVNDANERLVADELKERGDWYVTSSHEIARQSKEYERFATTLLNAFVGPRVDDFLQEFKEYLTKSSVSHDRAFLIAANGGAMTIDAARVSPVRIINSGPAGGAQASIAVGRLIGARNIITCDMGGTSTDVSLIKDLDAVVTSEGYIDRVPFIVPHLDLVTIGTGGGSVAWVDIGGELEVGPRSARAFPGPACYGRGGTEPTLTDANAVLERLSDEQPLGGTLKISRTLAEEAVSRLLPSFDGMSLMDLAEGIVRIAVARMATALRDVSVARGLDPREFTLIAYGGAGPMHAAELANELDIAQVVVPPIPGNFSALGLIMSDLRHDFVQSRTVPVETLGVAEYSQIFGDLEQQGRDRLRSEGFSDDDIEMTRTADMRFAGQWFELNVPMPPDVEDMLEIDRLFREAHVDRYQIDMERPTEFVNFRVTARGVVQKPNLGAVPLASSDSSAPKATRNVHLHGELREVPVYDRAALPTGVALEGPAIVEEFGSTIFVETNFAFRAQQTGVLVMERAS